MEEVLKSFKKLLEIMEKLMGPGGCPWDREQTMVSMRGSLLEEAYEVLEALDEENYPHLAEELGDLFYNILFFAHLGEKEGRFTLALVLQTIAQKLIVRHPHVFGEGEKLESADAVLNQWETIKSRTRESLMDGIPKALPALTKANKFIGRMQREQYSLPSSPSPEFENDRELGELLWAICLSAKERGLHPEHALQDRLYAYEKEFRLWEKGQKD